LETTGTLEYTTDSDENSPVSVHLVAKVDSFPRIVHGRKDNFAISVTILFIPVHTVTLSEAEAESVFFADWKTALAFNKAFPDLASVPPELNYVPIASAVVRITDLQPKREQEIEVVGLKIPVSELVKWGSFFCSLCRFTLVCTSTRAVAKLDGNSPGRDVAWIGLYRSKLAAAAVMGTVCIAPVWAAFALAVRSVSSTAERAGLFVWPNAPLFGALAVSLVLAALTGERILKLRCILYSQPTGRVDAGGRAQ